MVSKINPFEKHPDQVLMKKKSNNILTLEEISDIISKQNEKVLNLPPATWGFTREDISMHLQEVLEEVEKACQNN